MKTAFQFIEIAGTTLRFDQISHYRTQDRKLHVHMCNGDCVVLEPPHGKNCYDLEAFVTEAIVGHLP